MLNCPTCGELNSEQDQFCQKCGVELVPQNEPIEVSSLSTKNSPKPSASNSTIAIAKLTKISDSGAKETTFPFEYQDKPLIIGRFDPDSGPVDVDLNSLPSAEAEYISRHHCQIWRDALDNWLIKDLGAKNGVFFRAVGQDKWERIKCEQIINDHDQIALGNVKFEFHF